MERESNAVSMTPAPLAVAAAPRAPGPLGSVAREFFRRYRQTLAMLRRSGLREVIGGLRSRLAGALSPGDAPLPVRLEDVLAADPRHPPSRPSLASAPGQPMVINWIMTPPARGSGGHTTIFRIANALQARGHANRVYFYDRHFGDHRYYEEIVRDYYGFKGLVGNIDQGMADAHITMATGWPTVYPVFNSRSAGTRCYFVQDFEPSFHATSSASVLAEATYRMGFHGITAGRWLSRKLAQDYGMSADHFDFGCDLDSYSLRPGDHPREGICFYVRPSAARRASELGMMAVELFAQRRPRAEIHLYGDPVGKRGFEFIDHGHVTPAQLNDIYARCKAGLTLSLTNVSLVPHEMLASGCIPVVNDAEHNRIVLDNAFVHYADLTPHALADALEAVLDTPDFASLSRSASASVRSQSWDDAATAVETALRRLLSR